MMNNNTHDLRTKAAAMFLDAGLILRSSELDSVEMVDFGLGDFVNEGALIATLVGTDRLALKALALLPNQTEPEHRHPAVGDDPGKEETARCLWGEIRFYTPGGDTMNEGFIPKSKGDCYSCRHETILKPGDQMTLQPGTPHWFQAGPRGGVMLSISTCARDAKDRFTDPEVIR